MKRKIVKLLLLSILTIFLVRGVYFIVCNATYQPQDGDVIFHISESNQSKAIKIGTLSRYSHCGIIVVEKGQPYVIEAENGVEKTPLSKWLKRGKMGRHYRIMRLKDEQTLSLPYKKWLGRPYDRYFQLGRDRFYCSELVWEMYRDNGITLCEPNQLQDYYFLNIPAVQKHIKARGLKLDQEVVAPSDLVKSSLLRIVSYGYGTPLWL